MKKNPMFDVIKVGDLIYLGSHPWNTGDVFGHFTVVEKADFYMLVYACDDVRSACEYTPTRHANYSVMAHDKRKIIRLA